jgi:hypothetical protein
MVRGVTRDRESARCPVPKIALTITFGDGILTHVVPLPQEPRLRFDFSDPMLKLRDRKIDFCGRCELARLNRRVRSLSGHRLDWLERHSTAA